MTRDDALFFEELTREAEAWKEGPGKDLFPAQGSGHIVVSDVKTVEIIDSTIVRKPIDPEVVAHALGAIMEGPMPRRRH